MFEMNALSEILKKYPAREGHTAISGLIPFDELVENEKTIREHMRLNRIRSVYRGPREKTKYGFESWTRRRNAQFVVLYWKG